MQSKPREVLQTWDGPVVDGDRYFSDLEHAAEHYHDDMDWPKYSSQEPDRCNYIKIDDFRDMLKGVPEFMECCDIMTPVIKARQDGPLEDLISSISENHPVIDDDEALHEHVTGEHLNDLRVLINDWLKSLNWSYWEGNGKLVRFRDLVVEYEIAQYESWLETKFGKNSDCRPHSRECDCDVCGDWCTTRDLLQERYDLLEELQEGP